jgi:Protein of unknown function (DUF3298)
MKKIIEKTTSRNLEKSNWIAGILSAALAILALGFTIWSYIHPPESSNPQSTPTAKVEGSNNIVVLGNNNTIAPQKPNISSFASIKVSDISLPIDKSKKHSVRFPSISGMESLDIQARINHLLKRTVLTIYEKYENWDEVDIQFKVGFTEFNLLGLNVNVMIFNSGAAHPLSTTQAMVIDLNTAGLFELKDLFRTVYKSELDRIVVSKLKQTESFFACAETPLDKQQQEANRVFEGVMANILGHESKVCFSGIADNSQFYLTDTSVVLVFPKYSIAPGASGDIELKINFQDIRGILNPNGPLQRFL